MGSNPTGSAWPSRSLTWGAFLVPCEIWKGLFSLLDFTRLLSITLQASREPEGDPFGRVLAVAHRDDDVLLSVVHVCHRAPPSIAGFSYRWVRDEDVLGHSGAVVERCPSSCTEGVKRELLWIDTDRYLLHRVDYFDSDGVHRRTLRFTGYELVDGFWRAMHMEMAEAGEGGKTVLDWSQLRLGIGLRERDFDPARLGEVR